MNRLKGKTAVITGGNSGIGLAAAQRLDQEGAQVAIFGRNRESLDAALASLDGSAIAVQGDVRNSSDLERLFAEVAAAFGKIDVLFVNAGVAKAAPFAASDESLYDEVMDINVKGAYFTVQKALPRLNDGASVILTSSTANAVGIEGFSVYGASKAAVRSLARTLSSELAGRRIRVNAISPGAVQTPIFGKLGVPEAEVQKLAGAILSRTPLGTPMLPEDVAGVVAFLASDESRHFLGSDIYIDAGIAQI